MLFTHSTHKRSYAILFALLLLVGCDSSSTGPEESYSVFPESNLQNARNYAIGTDADNPKGRALVIWHDGNIVFQDYAGDFDGEQLHTLFSGSKSFAGILAAIAVKNGLFTFDTTLGELVSQWDPESERGKVTVRQLLTLTSGIETAPAASVQTAEEWLSADMRYERGSTFVYGPTPFYILSWIFVEELGIDPIDYLAENLFTPLGVGSGEWLNVSGSYPNLSFGCEYSALDWLQIGILLENHGTLNGTEIIPDDLFNELLTPTEANPGYGITFWLNHQKSITDIMPDDLFMMSGLAGQKLYVVPSLNLVIVRFGLLGEFEDEDFFTLLMNGVNQSTF